MATMNLLLFKRPGDIKMVRKGTVVIILLLGHLGVSVAARCTPCPPGAYWKADCLEGSPNSTVCETCTSGTFLSRPNMAEGCFVHKVCDKPNMITKSQGNATRDTVCGCEEGYHMERGSCARNVYCPPSEGITDDGQRCEICPNGTYSDKLSNVEPCLPWKNCSVYGLDVATEGTSFSDRVCVGQSGEDTSTAHFTTVITDTKATPAAPHVIKVIMPSTTNTLIVAIVVSTVVGGLGCLGIYALVIRKGCKHYRNKRPQQYHMHITTDDTAEEALAAQEGSKTAEDMQSSVECEEDSICTHPKLREVSTSSINQADSQIWLLQNADDHITLPTPLPCHIRQMPVVDNPTYESSTSEQDSVQHEEPVTVESSQLAHPIPIEIQPKPLEDLLVSPDDSTEASSRQTSESSLAYRREGVNLVLDIYAKELTSRQVEQLAAELGQDWPHVAQRLGLEQYQIDHILNDYKTDIQEKVRLMLRNWQEQKTGNATLADLNAALLECSRGELCRRLLLLSDAARS